MERLFRCCVLGKSTIVMFNVPFRPRTVSICNPTSRLEFHWVHHTTRRIDSKLTIRVRHGRQEIVTSHCRSIVTLKVPIHALSKAFFWGQQGLIHSNDFCSLSGNARRVKVVHETWARHWHRIGQEDHRRRLLSLLLIAGTLQRELESSWPLLL
jgi:hypothetical protein